MRKVIYRIDVSRKTVEAEDAPDALSLLGGRGLCATLISREVSPAAQPISKQNKCIVAPGLLSGTSAPCSGRLSIGRKSPLTETVKESNAGGLAPQKLARLGIKALVFEGDVNQEGTIIQIDKTGVRIRPGKDYQGVANYECVRRLRREFGEKVSTLSVGPAGERGFLNSTVAVSDMDGIPTRQAARGGMGALLALKGVKAIVVDDTGASSIEPRDPEKFKMACKFFARYLIETKQMLRNYGTAGIVHLTDQLCWNITHTKFYAGAV